MSKRFVLPVALFTALTILTTPAYADCDPQDPDCPITPPQSVEVDSDVARDDSDTGEVGDPGVLAPLESNLSHSGPKIIDPVPFAPQGDTPPVFDKLDLPMRWQDPTDVSCGIQALGMAFDGLAGGSPSSPAILNYLEHHGLMYDFGTGVEELAYAAQSFGYKGSVPIHGWGLKELQEELTSGRPVVVSIGMNGSGNPGHFVTVTGVSADGKWVSYNDPTLGKTVIPADEFMEMWGLQGHSGVAVRKEAPSASAHLVPWVAAAAGLMGIISQTPLALRRMGIGGRFIAHGGGSRRRRTPRPRTSKPHKFNKGWQIRNRRRTPPPPTPEPSPIPIAPTETPIPPPEGTPTPTPVPYVQNKFVLPQEQRPSPPGFIASDHTDPVKGVDGKWIGRGIRYARTVSRFFTARSLMFKALEDGNMSVSAPSLPVGEKIPFRQGYGFDGTRYSPGNISRISGRNLIRGAISKTTWFIALGTSLVGNIYDFTVGKNKGKSFQEFAVSTGVDTVMTVGTGLAAATGVVLFAAAFGLTLTAAPAIIATSIVALFIGLGLDQIGAGDWFKKHVNNAVDLLEEGTKDFGEKVARIPNTLIGIGENSRIIMEVVSDRIQEGINQTNQAIRRGTDKAIQSAKSTVTEGIKTIEETVQRVEESINTTVTDLADGAKRIIGNLFGGG